MELLTFAIRLKALCNAAVLGPVRMAVVGKFNPVLYILS